MPPATSSATPQSPGAEERPAHLSEGHLYLRVTAEVELGNRFSALQNLHWRQLLGLRLLRRGEKLRQGKGARRRERGCERTGDRRSSSGSAGSWPAPPSGRELRYLDVGAREDAHPAVVLAFVPVLIDLLVDVNNVALLQGKLPVNRGSCTLAGVSARARGRRVVVLAKGDAG